MSHPTGPIRRATALVLALGAVLLSGCSADDAADTPAADTSAAAPSSADAGTSSAAPSSTAAQAESETVEVSEGEMFIELSEDSFSAGTYTFEVSNTGNMPHDFVVEQGGSDVAGTDVLQPGESATLEVDLAPGDYVFYCSVDAHRAAGMEVPVTVEA
ncbi:cupredoxin domain-containing protein [Geodermatophilus chilensis]|uniref:cupredoxin domain-containing protein n=1 Tax=Geodermatophilus chilensis TaxID=2035835 RepID=UPI000C25CAD5|nr:cupredoxin domain-containing protein [Geodermatophilus chilensis]